MARLESVNFTPHRCVISDGHVRWQPVANTPVISSLPMIVWADGSPWREANLWFHEQASCRSTNIRTIQSNAAAICGYARWLEASGTKWHDFPPRKSERCLVRYRGILVDERNNGNLAPSTVSQRMRVIVNFYRWLNTTGLLSPTWPMWRDQLVGIRLTDRVGFERTIAVATTDLRITNRRAPCERLEDGLTPVSLELRDAILHFCRTSASVELHLMLMLGFFTGMRLGTLTDLKVQTLANAVPDPASNDFNIIAVGPGASPPVATKFGVTGQIRVPRKLFDALLDYAHSARRLLREAKAAPANKETVFLTRFGNPYARRGSDKSVAINVEMHSLRKNALRSGVDIGCGFRFHQSRCTFATELARLAIRIGGPINAIAVVKQALLHRDEATSLKYIKFIENSAIKEESANAFTAAFLGLMSKQR